MISKPLPVNVLHRLLSATAFLGVASLASGEILNELRLYDNAGGGVTGDAVPGGAGTLITSGGPGTFSTGATGLPASGSGTATGLVREVGAGGGGTDRYTITAAGSDYWGQVDRGAFAFDNAAGGQSGDFSAIVRSVAVAPNPADYLGPNWGRTGIGVRVDVDDQKSLKVDTARESGLNGQIIQNARPFNNSYNPDGVNLADENTGGGDTYRQFMAGGPENNANGTVRNTSIWMGLHRYNGNYYSTWAPDNAGTPGTWSSAVTRNPGAASPLLGTVHVGLFHQSHDEAKPAGSPNGPNSAVFDNFRVDNEVTDPAFATTLINRGDFPKTYNANLFLNAQSQVGGTASGSELGIGPTVGTNWKVTLQNVTPMDVPGLKHELYTNQAGLNSSAAWSTFLAGSPVPQNTQSAPSPGDVGGGVAPGVWFGGAGVGVNYYPPGWASTPGMVPPTGDGASNYAVRMTGEIFLPEAGTYRFKDGVDDYAYLNINGQVLIDDNDWTGTDGSDPGSPNGGSPIVSLTVPAAGFYSFEMRSQEGGGGDNTTLYWDYDINDIDVDGVRLGDNPGFPLSLAGDAQRSALVPYDNFQHLGTGEVDSRSGSGLVENEIFNPADPLVVPNDGQLYRLVLTLDGNELVNIQVQGVPEPGSVALVSLGLLGFLRRRRR